jgi:hypothetical protein
MKRKISKIIVVLVALLASVQTNAKGPPVRAAILTDANGVEIGRVIGMERIGSPYVLTDKGYRTLLNLGSSVVAAMVRNSSEIYYENTDCPKDEVAYLADGSSVGAVFSPTSDIENAYATGRLMYSPPDAQLVEGVIAKSMFGDDGCINFEESPVIGDGYPAYLNDPSITGIANTPYPSRLILK